MAEHTKQQEPARKRGEGKLVPVLCNVFGTILIIVVFAMVLPLSVPQLMGYEVYEVVSGSMEPAIPVGSVIYVRPVPPADVEEEEIVAFYEDDSVVSHRVVANRVAMRELVTKGDANNTEDLEPVPYDNVIGKVALNIPVLGKIMALYSSNVGKIYLFIALACGFMLNILADRLRVVRSQRMLKRLQAEIAARKQALAESGGEVGAAELAAVEALEVREPRRGGWVRTVIMAVLAIIFMGSAGVVVFVQHGYEESGKVYREAQEKFVKVKDDKTVAPIEIDFDELKAINEDVVGWIYCEDTIINYPVLQGETNDTYLRHDYLHDYNIDGSIFVDCDNRPGFVDASTIIYGHHMNYGTYGKMFEGLDEWQDQEYYEQHPVMWLLTPEQDYQIVLISGHHTNARSDMYDIYHEHDAKFQKFLQEAVEQSDFTPIKEATVNEDRNYVMLSTCAYIFENARYVLHGKLVPVDSAGGVAF